MGHTPAQICIDQNTKEALLRECWSGEDADGKLLSVPLSQVPRNDSMGIPIECEPELFFVTPEPAIRDTDSLKAKLIHLAVKIFNLQPSYGLAFIVASGLTDSYTAAMRMILRSGEASRAKVGIFLGATFSLCPLIRFGIFDSMALLHTGVVSALVLAFHSMQMPEDLQMIDRLVRGVALVWWRKHRAEAQVRGRLEMQEWGSHSGELVGHELLQYLASSDVLSQLMFSTVLLHWFVHCDGRRRPREMAAEAWLALNRGIENGGTDVPDHVQLRIHAIISRKFVSQLCLASAQSGLLSGSAEASLSSDDRRRLGGPSGGGALAGVVATSPGGHGHSARPPMPGSFSALASSASREGWVQIVSGDIPYPNSDDLYAGVPEASCRFEDSGAGGLYGVTVDERSSDGMESSMHLQSADGFVWASLCYVLLLFSIRPSADAASAPYAVVDARRLTIVGVDANTAVVKFVGHTFRDADKDSCESLDNMAMEEYSPVTVVILLPDGRWREKVLTKLELKFPSVEEMHEWVAKLIRGPLSCKTHAL